MTRSQQTAAASSAVWSNMLCLRGNGKHGLHLSHCICGMCAGREEDALRSRNSGSLQEGFEWSGDEIVQRFYINPYQGFDSRAVCIHACETKVAGSNPAPVKVKQVISSERAERARARLARNYYL